MTATRWGLAAALILSAACLLGCSRNRTVIDAFPMADQASPWNLEGMVWGGPFEAAKDSIGEEAARWEAYLPRGAWLARYKHARRPTQTLTVRALSFDSAEDAQKAYAAFAPLDAKPFHAGDRGCWTSDGVLFQWKRLVFDLFTRDAEAAIDPMQTVLMTAYLEKRMPGGLPENPR